MMKKLKTNRTTKIKFFILVPVAALLLTFISCVNNSENLITAVAPTKMNVLYLGVDNPVNISVSEHKPGDVRVEIDNGTITGENGNYIVHPKVSGKEAKISVYVKDKKVNESVFRVKIVPDPVPEINNRNPDWTIKKEILLNEPGIYAEMKNFDFDLHFTVVEFTLSAVIDGFNNDAISNSDKFTPKQKEIISKLKSGQKVYIENIKAVGPDSAIRKLGVIILKLE